jgi:hypothetical protein
LRQNTFDGGGWKEDMEVSAHSVSEKSGKIFGPAEGLQRPLTPVERLN